MDTIEALEARMRKRVPGWRFVKELHYRKFRRERVDAGERLGAAHDLPIWCDRRTAEASGTLSREAIAGIEHRLCLYPIPVDARLPWFCWKAAYTALMMEAFRKLGSAALAERWLKLDPVLRHEAAFIALRDHRVPADAPTDAENHAAFAVEFLVAWRFSPSLLPYLFPTVMDNETLAGQLAEGVDEVAIFEATRPDGIAEPGDMKVLDHPDWPGETTLPTANSKAIAGHDTRALRRGNAVRAAIESTLASDAPAANAAIAEHLVPTLAKVFDWDADKQAEWSAALAPVVRAAAAPGWNPAAKFLYDLQTIAKDLAHDLYAVDPPGWFLSLGRRPMLRKLTLQRQSILLTELHRADKHLKTATLPDEARAKIVLLLHREAEHAESRLRRELEPKFHAVLDAVGLVPGTLVERLARDKVVAELLDHIAERGHIRMGDLRDALARNAFKMPDLAGPAELLKGDALLRANDLLALELDGIYHRGEIYLRWFQRGSAAAFGTKPGRFLTRFALIPFIAAFMSVAFAQYLEHEGHTIAGAITHVVQSQDPEVDYYAGLNEKGEWDWIAEVKPKHSAIQFTAVAWTAIGILTIFYLMMVNVPPVRGAVFAILKAVGRAMHFAIFTLPGLLWRSQVARMIRRNRLARILTRWLLVPLVFAGLAAAFVALFGGSTTLVERCFLGVLGLLALLMATPFGQLLRDGTEEAASDAWLNLRYNIIPGLLGTIAWFFRETLGRFQSLLYSVDEWFRYREGQSRPNLALKTLLGVAWFPVAYVFRFAIFLLIEPQINPLKHFPTVTVSHKLLLPMIPSVAGMTQINEGLVAAVFTGIPGIFGFLVWELKENWKLYAANRPPNLKPAQLGHHGETMRGLLRPGFHSGTIPKHYRKIRQAIVKAELSGGNAYAPKPLTGLHGVEHALQMFIERELVDLLNSCRSWIGLFPTWSYVQLGVQSVRIEFGISHPGGLHAGAAVYSGDVETPSPLEGEGRFERSEKRVEGFLAGSGTNPSPRPSLGPVRPSPSRGEGEEGPPPEAVIVFRHENGSIRGEIADKGFVSLLNAEQRSEWAMAIRGLFARGAVGGEYESVDWNEWVAYWQRAAK